MSNPPPNVLQLARQGDPDAIAALMNRHLEAQGITAHVAQQENRLEVSLEGAQIPHQADLVAYVKKGITGLELATVHHLTITGRQLGTDTQAWREDLVLKTSAPEETALDFDLGDAEPNALGDFNAALGSGTLGNDLDFDLGLDAGSDDLDLGLAEPGADLDFDLGFAEAAPPDDLAGDFELDLGLGEAPDSQLGDDLGAEFDLSEGAGSAADLDFDLGFADSPQDSGSTDLDLAFADAIASDLDFDLGATEAPTTDSLDLDFDLGTTEALPDFDLASNSEAAADFDLDLDLEEDFSPDFAIPSAAEGLDLGLGSETAVGDALDLDFGLAEEPLAEPPADLAFDLPEDSGAESFVPESTPFDADLDFDVDNLSEAGGFDSAAEVSFEDLGAVPDRPGDEGLAAMADLGTEGLSTEDLGPEDLGTDDLAGLDLDFAAPPAPDGELDDLWDAAGASPGAMDLEPLGDETDDLWDSSAALPDHLASLEPEPDGVAAEAIAPDTSDLSAADLDMGDLDNFSFDADSADLDLPPELGELPLPDLGTEDFGPGDFGPGDFGPGDFGAEDFGAGLGTDDLGTTDLGTDDLVFEDLGAAAAYDLAAAESANLPADLEGWPLEETDTLAEAGEVDFSPGEPPLEDLGLAGLGADGESDWEAAADEFTAEADLAAPDLYSPAPWEAEAGLEAVAADRFDLAEVAAAPWAEGEEGSDAAIADLGEAAGGEFDPGFVLNTDDSAFNTAPNPFEAEAWPPEEETPNTIDTLELEPEPASPEPWITSPEADLAFSEAEADLADLALDDQGWNQPDQGEAPLPPAAEADGAIDSDSAALGFAPAFPTDAEPEGAAFGEDSIAAEPWASEPFDDDLDNLPDDDFGAAAFAAESSSAEPFSSDGDFEIDDFGTTDFGIQGQAADEPELENFSPVAADTDVFEDDINSSNGFMQDLNGAALDNGELAAADDFIQEFGSDPSTHVSLRADQFNDDGSVRRAGGGRLPMKLIVGLGLGALLLALAGFLLNGLLGRLRAPSGSEPVVTESTPPTPAPPPVDPSSVAEADLFRQAVNAAQTAANLAQTASTSAQWQEVADAWAAAIDLMKRVPQGDPNYAVAQKKAVEYQPNFAYAQQNAERLR
jgi:hypothetical protein